MTRSPAPPLDRFFWLAILIAALVVIPRSALISRAHSPCADDQFHLRRGLDFLCGNPSGILIPAADPPLGQALIALPMYWTNSLPENPINPETMEDPQAAQIDLKIKANPPNLATHALAARRDVLYGHRLSVDTLEMLIAIWKAILFVPFAGLVFHWCRSVYGLHSGYLALALLLIDPTFAAHTAIAAPDVPAVEAIVFSCFFIWRYVQHPSFARVLLAAFFMASAMLMKHTAAPLPFIALLFALVWWLPERKSKAIKWRTRIDQLLVGALAVFLFIWALMRFDFSVPADQFYYDWSHAHGIYRVIFPALTVHWPAGRYVGLLLEGLRENGSFRWAYLNGHARLGGWWYYFPAVAAYKVPIGFFVIFLLALISLWKIRLHWDELSFALPLIILCALFFSSGTNVGFRHFLPAYIFILMLSSRCASSFIFHPSSFILRLIAWLSIAAAFAHTLTYHPDYLSYMNWPYAKPWLRINDSNIDWGQGLKQVREYLDSHPTNRPIYIRYDWDPYNLRYYLDGRVHPLTEYQPPPQHGILIICPVWVAGYWDPWDTYRFLRPRTPNAIIGHSMLVYDLDHPSK